jgi:hypothetical protein
MPEKSSSSIVISFGSQLLQSGIRIPASAVWSQTSPALPSYADHHKISVLDSFMSFDTL